MTVSTEPMPSLSLPSPAKINLFLNITGQRDNGYHDLQTIFQLLDFGDNLTFYPNESGKIHLNGNIDGVDEKNNLIVRAAKLLQSSTGCSKGCTIELDKKLPLGAGLSKLQNTLAPVPVIRGAAKVSAHFSAFSTAG